MIGRPILSAGPAAPCRALGVFPDAVPGHSTDEAMANQRNDSLGGVVRTRAGDGRRPHAGVVIGVLVCCAGTSDALAGRADRPPEAPPGEAVGGARGVEAPEGGTAPTAPDAVGSDDLFLFDEIPTVISGSRIARPITQSSLPVSIISGADVHYGGLTSIPEMLQFSPGFNTLRLDRNRYATGVRGFQHEFSDRTLFLLDGKSASSAFEGGIDFMRLPILPEDIERIEIVRGPGGAAWGANAFNGVVNVITKAPDQAAGAFASSTVNTFGDTLTHLRWGATHEKLSWKLSFGYERYESSQDAIQNSDFGSNDFARKTTFDGVGVYRLSDESSVTFGLGYADQTRGSEEFLANKPVENATSSTVRPHVRFDHKWSNDASMYLRWYGNFDSVDRPGFWDYTSSENDFEAQFNFVLGQKHHVSTGGNFRYVDIETSGGEPGHFVGDDSFNERWVGLFLIDRWELAERFTLEGQVRYDWYTETQNDWSGRLTALYALDSEKHHIVRGAVSKSFRAPAAALREFTVRRVPLGPPAPPGFFGVNGLQPDDLDNEETYAFEAGYVGTWAPGFTTSSTLTFQRYDDLIGTAAVPDPLSLGRTFFRIDNIDGADGTSFEQEVSLSGERGSISAWYAYTHLELDKGDDQPIRAFRPPQNSVGATGRLFIDDHWTLNTAYRYTGATDGTGLNLPHADATHRLDLTVSTKLWEGKGELMFGITDIFDDTRMEVGQLGALAAHETPGRSFFFRVQLKF